MGRSIGGIAAGFLVAFVVVLAVETIGLWVFPQPEGMDPMNPESVRQHLSEIATGSFVTVLVAWTIGAFTGPLVTRRIAGETPGWPSMTVAALFALLCLYNLVRIPSPAWFGPVAVLVLGFASMRGLRSRVWARP